MQLWLYCPVQELYTRFTMCCKPCLSRFYRDLAPVGDRMSYPVLLCDVSLKCKGVNPRAAEKRKRRCRGSTKRRPGSLPRALMNHSPGRLYRLPGVAPAKTDIAALRSG
jgi:hypothetical protein